MDAAERRGPDAPATALSPVSASGRIVALDALRGLALLGIGAVNVQNLIGPHSADGWRPLDRGLLFAVTLLVEGKFIAMFSLLFGVGMALQVRRLTERGQPVVPFLRRRLLVLGGFGLVHAIGIWSGDVLLSYAVAGFVLLGLRGWSEGTLRRLAVALWAGSSAVLLVGAVVLAWAGAGGDAGEGGATAAYTSGSYATMVAQRVRETVGTIALVPAALPWIVALMLLGVVAVRSGIVTDPASGVVRLRRAGRAGLVAGLPIAALGAWVDVRGPTQTLGSEVVSTAVLYAGAPVMAVAYLVGATRWILRHPGAVTDRLAAVGRMALTNYLSQSVLLSAWAYTGRYGTTTLAAGLGTWVAVCALQLWWSPVWLARHAQGPVEALWRRLTYKRRVV